MILFLLILVVVAALVFWRWTDLEARVAALEERLRTVEGPATPLVVPSSVVVPPLVVVPSSIVVPPAAVVSAASVVPEAAAQHEDAGSSSAWEIVVGANWLNRVGVLAIVIGIALAVGYTMGRTGPAGRVALGFACSLVLLGAGVWLERLATYRTYAYGLIAGGWAGTYFTTYAMHGIEQARIVDSPLIATVALAAVAAGMIAHSIKYRSQTVTGLAFLIAYATLALTPVTTFSLVATLPLSASLLLVALPLGWFQVSMLGIASTYLMFGLRGAIFFDAAAPSAFAGFATLWTYWLIFEAGDLFAQWRAAKAGTVRSEPMFAMNAIGLTATTVLTGVEMPPSLLANFLAVAAVSYAASAILRAKWIGAAAKPDQAAMDAISGSSQGALSVATLLLLWAILLRFDGTRETLAILLLGQMVFALGLTLRDRLVRLLGAGVGVVTFTTAFASLKITTAVGGTTWAMSPADAVAIVVALAFYANREWLRARGVAASVLENVHTWAACALFFNVLMRVVPAPYVNLAPLVASWLLIEAGLRRDASYRYQGYALAMIGAGLTAARLLAHAGSLDTLVEAWKIGPVAVAWLYAAAIRSRIGLSRVEEGGERRYAVGTAVCAGTAMLALFEWRVSPDHLVAAAWAGTGVAIIAIALWRNGTLLPWQGYSLLLIAAARTLRPLVAPYPGTESEPMVFAAGVVAALFAGGLMGRYAAGPPRSEMDQAQDVFRLGTLVAGSIALVLLIVREVDPSATTLALGLAGIGLVGAGLPLRERVVRLSGLAIVAIAIGKLFVSDLVRLDGLARIGSFVVSGLGLLALSWVYTRYREQIRKLL
jgi:hypothetical protein